MCLDRAGAHASSTAEPTDQSQDISLFGGSGGQVHHSQRAPGIHPDRYGSHSPHQTECVVRAPDCGLATEDGRSGVKAPRRLGRSLLSSL
jgi:hypothetical protein